MEKQLIGNIKEYFENMSPQQKGVSAAILTKELPLKEASEATKASMGMISIARSQVRKE